MCHARLPAGRGGTFVRARLHATRHPAHRPAVAAQCISAPRDRRNRPTGVRLGCPCQRRCHGAHRLPVPAGGAVERPTDSAAAICQKGIDPCRLGCRSAGGGCEEPWQRLRPLRVAVVEQRRRAPEERPARCLLVVGPLREPDRGHPQPGHCRGARRQIMEAGVGRALRCACAVLRSDRRVGATAQSQGALSAEPGHPGRRVGTGPDDPAPGQGQRQLARHLG